MSTPPSKLATVHPYPFWAPRFWHGMMLVDWVRLLRKNRCSVDPSRWGLATTITMASLFNWKMRFAQSALVGHRIARTSVPTNPIFVLGHWRSGTTFLHELLAMDYRFATPTTYQCFAANHFLLTEAVLTRLLWFMLPSQRPMDNMATGWNLPQEDEFALCAMGLPSPYLRMAFPNHEAEYLEYLDMQGIDHEQISKWQEGFMEFLRQMSLRYAKQIVLKSPTHTGRVGLLAQMFPQAKFIHISRSPYDVVPSTLRLWHSLDEAQGLQVPRRDDLESYVHRAYERMYRGYMSNCETLPSNRLVEIRFEDLVKDGMSTIEHIYEQLELDGFDHVRGTLEQNLQSRKNYQPNQHQLDAGLMQRINQHWGAYFHRFGYAIESGTA